MFAGQILDTSTNCNLTKLAIWSVNDQNGVAKNLMHIDLIKVVHLYIAMH